MADRRPSFIIKDCSLNLDGTQRIGQCASITIPVPEKTVETFRNAGMVKPREVMMGYEATTASFTETAFDPAAIRLFGVTPGRNRNIIAYGYAEDEDGTEHGARFEMVAELKKIDAGGWTPGDKSETEYDIAVHEGRLFIDDEEIFAFNDFEVSVGGVVQQPGRRTFLRLA